MSEEPKPETAAEPAPPRDNKEIWDQAGLCDEAQADGVPCPELGRDCEVCERARRPAPPDLPA